VADAEADPAGPAEVAAPQVRILAGTHTTIGEGRFAGFTCDLKNAGQAPVTFVGYRSDSFAPPLEEGQLSPIYVIEVERSGVWEEYPIGWCGTGMDAIPLSADGHGTFGFAVPMEPHWDRVRVGVRWSTPLDFATADPPAFRVAWSDPFGAEDLAAGPAE
jgi:hypothetical protein